MTTITREQLLAMSGEEVFEALTGRPAGTRVNLPTWQTSVDQSADTVVGRRPALTERDDIASIDDPARIITVFDSGRCRIAGLARDAVRYAEGISTPPPGHVIRAPMRRGVVSRPK